jgi:hypothetical protein
MKKQKVGLLIIVTGILGLCGLLYVSSMLPHNIKFKNYKRAFDEIHHPEYTKFVAGYKLLGVLDYQRTMYKETYTQGCDYIVGEIREYQGDKASIEAFYAKQTIMVEEGVERIAVRFIPINELGQIDPNDWEEYGPNGIRLLQNIDATLFTRLDPSKSYYFVFFSEQEFSETERDIRCLF